MNIVACIDHRLARLESAARTFLRSDLHRREARAAVERDVFNGADKLADAEAEIEVHEGSGLHWCAGLDATTNVPTDLAASGNGPAAESEPPSPAAGHSTSDECTCFWTPEHMWTTHYGAVEPGSQREWNPECPVDGGVATFRRTLGDAADGLGQWLDGEACHDPAWWRFVIDRLKAAQK